jgi:hypothetical protein
MRSWGEAFDGCIVEGGDAVATTKFPRVEPQQRSCLGRVPPRGRTREDRRRMKTETNVHRTCVPSNGYLLGRGITV